VAERDARDARRETEEAARTGRFPDEAGTLRDESSPAEPAEPAEHEIPPEEVDDDDTMRFNEAYPLRDDLPGVVVTPPSNHRRDENLDQSRGTFDRGVDTEHLRSPSQGARPDPISEGDTGAD
jgi:hypothetical protein